MKIKDVIVETGTQPKTPEQQRVAVLKANKDRAADALKAERARQSADKAQKTLAQARQTIAAATT